MPHQCTQCGHTFPDGSKEMLSGCPDCGGNKFQFKPAADARASTTNGSDTPSATTPSEPSPRADSTSNPDAATEDTAQADARREVVSHDELADESAEEDESEPTDEPEARSESDDSNMAALRRELDDQFESIKILEPGQYELNLMELYNREEYIIALQEDGQYVIEVPDSWLGNDDE